MILKKRTATGYIFERETGELLALSNAEARNILTLLKGERLRADVRDVVNDYDGDMISLGSLDMTVDEFIDEVCAIFEDDLIYGDVDYPSDTRIQDAVIDTARDYGILIDE